MPLRQSGLAPNFKLTFIVKTDSRCTHPNTTGNRWTHNPLLMPPYQSALHRHLHIRVVAAPQQFVSSACMEPSPYSNQPSNLNKYKPYSLIRRHRTCRTSEHANIDCERATLICTCRIFLSRPQSNRQFHVRIRKWQHDAERITPSIRHMSSLAVNYNIACNMTFQMTHSPKPTLAR